MGSLHQNGVYWRRNRTLKDTIRSIINYFSLSKSPQRESLKTIVYILNRVRISALTKTPTNCRLVRSLILDTYIFENVQVKQGLTSLMKRNWIQELIIAILQVIQKGLEILNFMTTQIDTFSKHEMINLLRMLIIKEIIKTNKLRLKSNSITFICY